MLLWHLVGNHPLPDGNKRAAYLATIEFVRRNGRVWQSASPNENDRVIRGVAAGDVSQEELVGWVAERIRDLPMHIALAERR